MRNRADDYNKEILNDLYDIKSSKFRELQLMNMITDIIVQLKSNFVKYPTALNFDKNKQLILGNITCHENKSNFVYLVSSKSYLLKIEEEEGAFKIVCIIWVLISIIWTLTFKFFWVVGFNDDDEITIGNDIEEIVVDDVIDEKVSPSPFVSVLENESDPDDCPGSLRRSDWIPLQRSGYVQTIETTVWEKYTIH